MSLTKDIQIRERFKRSIRIDQDFQNPNALEDFYCSSSSANLLSSMVGHITKTGQCAFTWTGPYGSGKSSLALFFCILLRGNKQTKKRAVELLDPTVVDEIYTQFGSMSWNVFPVVGRYEHPAQVIGEVIDSQMLVKSSRKSWTDSRVISFFRKTIEQTSNKETGTILFVDEMGKFLEYAASGSADPYFFQELAEISCRSNGRFIFVGILHQAFVEYSSKLNQNIRDEWAKIQGRFVDLALRSTIDEQIYIVSQAIDNSRTFERPGKSSQVIASLVGRNHSLSSRELAKNLEQCWPLHPAVVCLLGPMSKSRFGQNQRSIFSFLSSAEPHGFQDFIRSSRNSVYEPYRFWDYLRINLESLIYASPDGHRWALASESIDRCEAQGGKGCEIKLLKTIAVIDFFRNRSGLVGGLEVLNTCMSGYSKLAVQSALKKIQDQSYAVYRKYINGYSIFAGSDFDIEAAIDSARTEITGVNLIELKRVARLQPILAKRHYHDTGALRWFDVVLVPLKDAVDYINSYQFVKNVIGLFLIAVPTQNESKSLATKICRNAGRQSTKFDVIVGLSEYSWKVAVFFEELIALQRVNDERLELASDSVARREIQNRLASLQANLEIELKLTVDNAVWFLKHHKPKRLNQLDLNLLASKRADLKFNLSPRVHLELLNRNRPSGNAIAAQNILLRRMIMNSGEKRLGIEGCPAEYAFYLSLLEQTAIYAECGGKWMFQSPRKNETNGKFRIKPLWDAALNHIKSKQRQVVEVSQIYDLWHQPPYGVKDGIMPILVVALILSLGNRIAFYREGVFQVEIGEIDIEFLAKHPESVGVRWIDSTAATKELLSQLAEIAKEYDQDFDTRDQSPIHIARGLVSIFENLPQWTARTSTLSPNALVVRSTLKQARDPNQFLFDDLFSRISQNIHSESNSREKVIEYLRRGLDELVEAYPNMLLQLRDILLEVLGVANLAEHSLQSLNERAQNIVQISGDFRLEALVGRLAQMSESVTDFEGLVSLTVNKLPSFWVDSDISKARIELVRLARKFVKIETFAKVKGRKNKRQAMAIILGVDEQVSPLIKEFDIADSDQPYVNELVSQITDVLNQGTNIHENIILAALAQSSADYMNNRGTGEVVEPTDRSS